MTNKTVSIVPDGVVAYGIQLPVQALSTRIAMPWERESGTVDDMVRVAQACDAAGFLYVAACHHVAIPREPAEAMSTTWFDPVATLGFLAAHTRQTRLMTNVFVASYRHPLETAKAFATVDALSNGRLLFGVGAGHVEGEFDALGVPFAERGAITDEAIDAILASWLDEWAPHNGDRWQYADVGQAPRPVQQPHPPIWIGGSGKPALRRVARVGDGWIPQATPPDRLPEDIAYILVQCPRSATTRACSSVSPRGTCRSSRCAATTASSTGSTASARSGSRTFRCVSRRDRPPSCASR